MKKDIQNEEYVKRMFMLGDQGSIQLSLIKCPHLLGDYKFIANSLFPPFYAVTSNVVDFTKRIEYCSETAATVTIKNPG
jgi:hypothetical protein